MYSKYDLLRKEEQILIKLKYQKSKKKKRFLKIIKI
jgi:hypothetical protein